MATAFALNTNTGAYPTSVLQIFGSDYGHSNFVTPMARFEFFDSFGSNRASGSPIIFIRMAGSFQSALQNGYSESSNIFGTPNNEGKIDFAYATVKGGVDALLKQAASAGGSAAGFIGSAGLSGKAQYEFMTRKVLNTFQQLIYSGPTFRRFTLPFTMKPTSLEEAKIMINIIKTFRIASSPKGAGDGTPALNIEGKTGSSAETKAALSADAQKELDQKEAGFISQSEINLLFGQGAADAAVNGTNRTFTFGYPDMCKFQIILQDPKSNKGDGGIAEVFGSEYCVIENVQVDYGSQNKMVFFSSAGTGGIYYPSEVTLSIGLRETTLPLAGQISSGHEDSEFGTPGTRTIF